MISLVPVTMIDVTIRMMRLKPPRLPVRGLRTILLQISHEAGAGPGLGVAIARVAAIVGTSEELAVCPLEAFGALAAPPGQSDV